MGKACECPQDTRREQVRCLVIRRLDTRSESEREPNGERCSLTRYCAGLGHGFLSKRRALENSRLQVCPQLEQQLEPCQSSRAPQSLSPALSSSPTAIHFIGYFRAFNVSPAIDRNLRPVDTCYRISSLCARRGFVGVWPDNFILWSAAFPLPTIPAGFSSPRRAPDAELSGMRRCSDFDAARLCLRKLQSGPIALLGYT